MPKKRSYPSHTTIRISKETLQRLNEVSKKGESYDSALNRILSGKGDVWVDILSVDGDSPAKHQVLLKLGDFYYRWANGEFTPIDPRKVKTVVEGVPSG